MAANEVPMHLETNGTVREARPNIVDSIKNDEIALIVNTTEGTQAIADSADIRRSALQHKVTYTTTLAGAEAVVEGLNAEGLNVVRRLQDIHAAISSK
jgi:carbamoyl-phosphate synthase large subunit